ncbi:MAG: nucleoside-triphosphatase [Clostridium sp.]|uniref:nucleoside-triphosphatase n=1 Tax=Clostridium sp. TaxID=1506 RepID=UPI003D6D2CC0
MGKIILLSGEPRVGKTTALKKIIQMIGECNCTGFYTEEIRDDFDRVGFDCVSLDGRRKRIADVNLHSEIRMGRYGIDIEAFEDFALQAINNSSSSNKIIIIDEIGPIQLLSTKFKQAIKNILTSSTCVIGTIFYNKHDDVDEIKKISGIKIYSMTNENRSTIIENIFHEIQG